MFRPGLYREFPVIHALNFLIYVLSLFSFHYFLTGFIGRISGGGISGGDREAGSAFGIGWLCLGYSLFLWSSLAMISLGVVNPDLPVSAVLYLAGGILVRVRPDRSFMRLAIGYWIPVQGPPAAIGIDDRGALFPAVRKPAPGRGIRAGVSLGSGRFRGTFYCCPIGARRPVYVGRRQSREGFHGRPASVDSLERRACRNRLPATSHPVDPDLPRGLRVRYIGRQHIFPVV